MTSIMIFIRYRGGLDNCNNQTGESSVYTEFKGQEIMFHVSTMLPYDVTDRQQVTTPTSILNLQLLFRLLGNVILATILS